MSVDEGWAEKRGIGKVEYDEMRCSVPRTAVRYSKQNLCTSLKTVDQNSPNQDLFSWTVVSSATSGTLMLFVVLV